jgi:hypothetical protein
LPQPREPSHAALLLLARCDAGRRRYGCCVTGNAYDRLSGRFVLATWYRVPAVALVEFDALQRDGEEIYRRHALSWALEHDTREVEQWREAGPLFQEQADLRAAAEEFDARPGLLDRLAEFQLEYPPGAHVFAGGWSHLSIEPTGRFETVMHAELDQRTAQSSYDLPPVDPERMTDAMRRAQRLARFVAPRLDAVVPKPFSMRAANELVVIDRDDKPVARVNLVDLDIESAAGQVLEELQNFLTEELTVPWPQDPRRGYEFHEPRAENFDGALRMWYGEADDPALTIEPIPMAELGEE